MNDVKSIRITGTGDTTLNRARVVGIHVFHDGVGAARLTLRETGASGTVLLDLDFEAVADTTQISIPQSGILFQDLVWASAFTNITAATIFYVG